MKANVLEGKIGWLRKRFELIVTLDLEPGEIAGDAWLQAKPHISAWALEHKNKCDGIGIMINGSAESREKLEAYFEPMILADPQIRDLVRVACPRSFRVEVRVGGQYGPAFCVNVVVPKP